MRTLTWNGARPDWMAVRVGDIFALLIDFYYSQRNYSQALRLIEDMRERKIILSPYLDQEMVQTVYREMGVASTASSGEKPASKMGDDSDDGGIEEEISDSIEEELEEDDDDAMFK